MAKGIAGGMPLSAVTGRAELMDAVYAGGLGGTYGGNPVTCAAAVAALGSCVNSICPHVREPSKPRWRPG